MRLIDADALMEVINRHCYPVQHDMTSIEPGMTLMGMLQAIQEQPTIEPERKKGKWMVVDADIAESSDICECDQCGGRIWKYKNAKDTWHFCPRCGADMRGEQDE